MMPWDKRHLIEIDPFSREDIEHGFFLIGIFEPYSGIVHKGSRRKKLNVCEGDMMTMWFQPREERSTRTFGSFQAAMSYLGGDSKVFDELESSMVKAGESVEDTARIMSGHSQLIVDRHRDPEHIYKVVRYSTCPAINAGNGSHQHPTQSLLDLYTIYKKRGKIDGITVAILGDLREGRTAHSLVKALEKFDEIHIVGIHPRGLELPNKFATSQYEDRTIGMRELNNELKNIAPDVVYATRIQKERMEEDASQYSYVIDEQTMNCLPKHTLLMHPLPRSIEIDPRIDSDPRAIYFEQADNGVPVRMYIIATLLGYEQEVLALRN